MFFYTNNGFELFETYQNRTDLLQFIIMKFLLISFMVFRILMLLEQFILVRLKFVAYKRKYKK